MKDRFRKRLLDRMCALGFLALGIVIAAGCGGDSGPEAAGTTVKPWSVVVPDVEPRTLDEAVPVVEPDPEVDPPSQDDAESIVDSDPDVGPSTLDVGELSAAVFELGSDELNTSHVEWLSLIDDVCGGQGLLAQALAADWFVAVTGFVDSSGDHGPGTLNDLLQETRATAAGEALIAECNVPNDRLITVKGGIGGDGAEARKVTVIYVRVTGDGESS